MPTPACSATAAIGAPGSATTTARAEARIAWSFLAACARRPLSRMTRRSYQNEAFPSALSLSRCSSRRRPRGDRRRPPRERGPRTGRIAAMAGQTHARPLVVALVLLKVGLVAFGGPIAHVAFMRREVVERRRWLDEPTFLRMFAACNLVPGPSSTELAIFIGYRLAGWPGLLLAGALFIAPAALLMLAIAWAYTRFGAAPALAAALGGVRPVVV